MQRAPLAITIRMYPADSAVWNALGWGAGLVPRASVTIQRAGSFDPTLSGVSDSSGVVRFTGLLTGSYTVSGVRVLNSVDRARLPVGEQDVEAIASGTRIVVDTPSASGILFLPLSRRGSLVVSEYWFPITLVEGNGQIYPFGGFVELYNNSDTTIYLDSLTFGDGTLITDVGPWNSCSDYLDMIWDSTGVWFGDLFRFPGSGHDHPLAPGKAVVLATDAVDHRTVNDSATDLTHADFEFIGPSDVDNPAVPNMINLSEHVTPLGHGWFPLGGAADVFVGPPINPDTLPTRVIYTFAAKYYHVARSAISSFSYFDFVDPRYTKCSPIVSPVFDAASVIVPYADWYWPSFKRKVLRYLADGRAVLQNTRTSAQDFEFTFPRTPGVVP